MKHSSRLIAFLIGLSFALGVAPAAASTTIGAANVFSAPGVAVNPDGTAFIAWRGPESGAGSLQFCRLPRGATVCDIRSAITAPGDTVSRPFVTTGASRVIVYQYRYGVTSGMYRFTSEDRGAHFGPGVLVGSVPFFEAVNGPGPGVSGVSSASGSGLFQRVAAEGSPTDFPSAALSADHVYNGTVGLAPTFSAPDGGILPVTVFTTGSDEAETRVYDGSGDVNDASNWLPPLDLGIARYPKLAGGPDGLFLLAGSADNEVFVREWNGLAAQGYRSFRPPILVADNADPSTLHAFEDASGSLHTVFARSRAEQGQLRLAYATSSDMGRNWQSGNIASQDIAVDGGISDPRIAVAPDHIGIAVWNAGFHQIRVTAVGPKAPQPPQTKISAGPDKRSSRGKAKFRFRATTAGSTFECKLDKRAFLPCSSPAKFKVRPGKHVFQVRGTDPLGNTDPSPAKFKWKVRKQARR